MIEYTPFWKTIKDKNISTYKLIKEFNISSSTINRLRHNEPVSTDTINALCEALECGVEDVVVFRHPTY